MRILLLDNYDSFTYNLYDYLSQCRAEVAVVRNDAWTPGGMKQLQPAGIVLSPGPKRPEQAGATMEIIERYHASLPILGVCLGHQALGEFFGMELYQLDEPRHGKTSPVRLCGSGIFSELPETVDCMRYHSLALRNAPESVELTARSTDDDCIMAIRHREFNCNGLQFHPESIGSPFGKRILQHWLERCVANSDSLSESK